MPHVFRNVTYLAAWRDDGDGDMRPSSTLALFLILCRKKADM
jgi:hypothetical protein